MSCKTTYDPCLDGKLNQIGSYSAAARYAATQSEASATQSANSATASATSATQANSYLTQVTNIFEDFDERYLGSKTVAPTVDNQGNPLQEGAMYWNSVANSLYVWDGSVWVALPTGFNEFTNFFATGTPTARNLVTRTADVVNVKDFGAVGDGIADDSSAIQAAVNVGTIIFMPNGTYNLSTNVNAANKYIILNGQLIGTGSIVGAQSIIEKSLTNKTFNHLVDWSVDASSREQYDSVFLKRIYEGTANTNSYFSGGSGIYSYQGYGQGKAALGQKASGTTNAVTGQINVWAAGNGTGTGRTEIVPIAGAAILQRDNIQSGINIYNEFSVIGPKSSNASDREGFLSGMTSLVMKFCPDNTIDAAHSGSYGATITTRPGEPGFGFESRSGDTTYPLRAGLSINGWSGLLATAPSGYSATATDGYEFGILIGGVAGSVWLDPASRSKIATGIGVTDYVNYAIDIFTKHPDAVANSGAIRVNNDAGVSIFGLNALLDTEARIQTAISSQFGSAIRVGASSHVTSERAGIQLGDWTTGQDASGNGTKDFFVYDGVRSVIKSDLIGTDPIWIYVDGALKKVTAGAIDSGGVGFKVLRVVN